MNEIEKEKNDMDQKKLNQGNIYRIRLEESLDRSFADWLGEITIIPQENGETLLVGQFADQAALRGLLNQLWNLNFTLISFERLEYEHDK